MRRLFKTILPIRPQDKSSESQKISYWLEKLFNQTRDKQRTELKEGITTEINNSSMLASDINIEQTPEEKGIEEAVKNHAGKAEENRQAVEDMVNNSNRILLKYPPYSPGIFSRRVLSLKRLG